MKIDGQKRPRTIRTLKKHIESLLRDKAGASEIDAILEEMFIRGLLSEINNRLKYTFDTSDPSKNRRHIPARVYELDLFPMNMTACPSA